MKTKLTMAILAGLFLAVHGFAQGRVIFANTAARAVFNFLTGLPVAPGVAKAGLYWTADLGAVPNVGVPNDAFALAIQQVGTAQIPQGAPAVVPIAPSAALAGVYLGGTVTITGAPGAEVFLQVRAWTGAFNSYAEAFNSGRTGLGASEVMRVKLAVGTDPNPSISGLVNSFMIGIPEPSTFLLGVVGGLGALVLLRRRG